MSQGSPENKNSANQAGISEADQAMLRQLHHVIDEEMRKPAEEQDEELISECIGTIAEIKGVKGSFSAEEIDEQIAIVKAKAAQDKAVRQPKRVNRVVVIAACVALLVAACAVTVYANPTMRAWFERISRGGIGAAATEQGVTYQYLGQSVLYDSVDELLAEQGIDICYPAVLPDGVWIERIVGLDINDGYVYSIEFNTTDISMRIQTNVSQMQDASAAHEVYTTSKASFKIYKDVSINLTTATGIINQSKYSFTVKNGLNIKEILNSLKETSK